MKKIILTLAVLIISIFSVHADYTKNINDEIKVYAIQKKVEKLLNTYSSEKRELIKDKVTSRIQNMLWKTHNEILKIRIIQDKKFDSFKQYVFAKIYRQIKYGIGFRSPIWWMARIVENNFVRALVYESEDITIFTTNNAIYDELWGGYKKMVEFYSVPNNVSAKDFIYNKFVKKNYNWKCKVMESEDYIGISAWIPWLWTYTIEAYWEYKKEIDRDSMNARWMWACGEYGQTNGIQYFKMISDNVLMFAMPGQSGIPIDLSSIESKKNIVLEKENILKDYKNGLILTNENNEICLLYDDNRLMHRSGIFAWTCLISQVEKWKSGIYILDTGTAWYSNLIMFDKNNQKNYLIKAWNTINKFELMTDKRIKLFYSERSGGGTKIINLK